MSQRSQVSRVYEGSNACSKVYLSQVYFCEMYPTCVSSKLCKFISLGISQKLTFSVLSVADSSRVNNSHPCGPPGCSPPPPALWSTCRTQDLTSPRQNWASSKISAFLSSLTSSRGYCSRPAPPPGPSSSPQGYWREAGEEGAARTSPRASLTGPFPLAALGSSPRGSMGLGSSGKDSKSCEKLLADCRKSQQSLLLSWEGNICRYMEEEFLESQHWYKISFINHHKKNSFDLKISQKRNKKYRKAVRWCASLIRSLYWLNRLIRIGFSNS